MRLQRGLAPFAVAALLAGCASTGGGRGEASSTVVPDVREEAPELCGLAAMEALEEFYEGPISDETKADLRKRGLAGGIEPGELRAAFLANGWQAFLFTASFAPKGPASIWEHLSARRPLIVPLGTRHRHYVVLTGYDPECGCYSIQDPAAGPTKIGEHGFEEAWVAAGRVTLLAVPKH